MSTITGSIQNELEVLDSTVRKEREIKGKRVEKEVTKLSQF